MDVTRKTVPIAVLGAGLIVGLTLWAAGAVASSDNAQTVAVGPVASSDDAQTGAGIIIGIDMDPTGNVCTGPASQGETCSIPSVERCISIPSDQGTTFQIDTFVTGLTNGFAGFNYVLAFPDTTTGANLAMTGQTETDAAVNLIMQSIGSGPISLSEFVPEPPGEALWAENHLSAVADFGTWEEATWTRGVLVRYEFTIQAGGPTPGVYGFTFTNLPGSCVADASPACYPVKEVWDSHFTPPYGILAMGVPCPPPGTVTPTPTLTPLPTPTPAPTPTPRASPSPMPLTTTPQPTPEPTRSSARLAEPPEFGGFRTFAPREAPGSQLSGRGDDETDQPR